MTSVSFAPTVNVIKNDTSYYYDNDICSNLWYTNEEFEAITKEATEIIKDMQHNCRKKSNIKNDYDNNNNNNNDSKEEDNDDNSSNSIIIDAQEESFCYRGLEALHMGKIFGCAKWLNRIVFLEQERQRQEKEEVANSIRIAEQYSKFTQRYADEARIMGFNDQKAAISSYMASPSLNDPTRLSKIKEAALRD